MLDASCVAPEPAIQELGLPAAALGQQPALAPSLVGAMHLQPQHGVVSAPPADVAQATQAIQAGIAGLQQPQVAVNVVPTVPRQPLPKQLTAAIKSASNVERLTQLFNDHSALLNPIHVAAMITKLPKLEATAGVSHLTAGGAAPAPGAPGPAARAPAAAPGAPGPGGNALPWLPPAVSGSRALLAQLVGKIKQHDMSEYSPRGLANIIWALAKLQHYPDPELQALLLDTFVERLPAAVPQDVSNVLWGAAKLTKEHSSGLTSLSTSASVPVAQERLASTPSMAGAEQGADALPESPLESPGSLDASGAFASDAAEPQPPADAAPSADALASPRPAADGLPAGGGAAADLAPAAAEEAGVLEYACVPQLALQPACPATAALSTEPLLSLSQVQKLLTHLCNHLQRAMVQTISNSLWAVVVLQHEHSWCMCGSLVQVQLLLHAFCQQPREALPGHIQPVIRCMSQLATACAVHNGDAWLVWQPPVLQRLLGHLFAQRSHMEQHHVSSVLRDIAQVACLLMLLQRRKLEAAAAAEGRPRLGPMPADDMLKALAASDGPPDTTGTMLALGMLRPQLAEMGLLPSVQHLCSMLSVMANHNQADMDNRLTAAAVIIGVAPPGTDASAALGQDPLAAGPTAFALLTMSAAAAAASAGHGAGGGAAAAAAAHTAQGASQQQAAAAAGALTALAAAASPHQQAPRPLGAAANQEQQQAQAGAPGDELDVFAAAAQEASAALVLSGGPGAGAGTGVPGAQILSAPTAVAGSISSSDGGSSGGLPPSVEAAAAALRQQLALNAQQQQQQSAAQPQQQLQEGDAAAAAGTGGMGLLSGAALAGLSGAPNAMSAAGPSAAASAHVLQAQQLQQMQQQAQQQQPMFMPHSGLPPHMAAMGMGSGSRGGAYGPPPGSSTDIGMSADWMHQEAAAKQLTHHIVSAESVWALVDIYNSNKSLMDSIHLTACITRLSKVLGSRPAANSPAHAMAEQLLPQIGQQLTPMLPGCNARGLANVLWGYGRLRMRPEDQSLVVLLQQFVRQVSGATSRDCAVVLWSLARLSEAQAGGGVPQDLLQQVGGVLLQHLCSFSTPRPPSGAAGAGPGAAGASPQSSRAMGGSSDSVTLSTDASAAAVSAASVASGAPLLLTVPTPRDISNSLMALSRLGFKPAPLPAASAAAAAAAAAIAAAEAGRGDPMAALADRAAAASPVPGADGAAGLAASPGAPAGQQHALLLPRHQLEILAHCLLSQAGSAKALDLQEAATALQSMGLTSLSAQLGAAGAHGDGPGGFGMLGAGGDPSGGLHRGAGAPASMQHGGYGNAAALHHAHMMRAAGGFSGAGMALGQRRGSGGSFGGSSMGGSGMSGPGMRQAQAQSYMLVQQQQLQQQLQQQQQQQQQLYGQQQAYMGLQNTRRQAQQQQVAPSVLRRMQPGTLQPPQQFPQGVAVRGGTQLQYLQPGATYGGSVYGASENVHLQMVQQQQQQQQPLQQQQQQQQQYVTMQYAPQQFAGAGSSAGGAAVHMSALSGPMVLDQSGGIMLQQLQGSPAASGGYNAMQQATHYQIAPGGGLQQAGGMVLGAGGQQYTYALGTSAGGGSAGSAGVGAVYATAGLGQGQQVDGYGGGGAEYLQAARLQQQQQQAVLAGQQQGMYQVVQYPVSQASAYGQLQQQQQQLWQQQLQQGQQQLQQGQQGQQAVLQGLQMGDMPVVGLEPPGLGADGAATTYYF